MAMLAVVLQRACAGRPGLGPCDLLLAWEGRESGYPEGYLGRPLCPERARPAGCEGLEQAEERQVRGGSGTVRGFICSKFQPCLSLELGGGAA